MANSIGGRVPAVGAGLLAVLAAVAALPARAQSAGEIGGGDSHTCAVLSGGTLKCWGHQEYNQLAIGRYEVVVATPETVPGISNAVAVTGGYQFTCVLLSTGQVKCFGYNRWGQTGQLYGCAFADGGGDCALVGGVDDAIDVAAGGSHACAVREGGGVQCWGINNHGQLGQASPGDTPSAIDVPGITDAFAVAAGSSHTCVLVGAGAVKCFGRNHMGQLGTGAASADPGVSTPSDVVGITDATAIAAGDAHTCVLLGDGTMRCWGHEPELGIGDTPLVEYVATPVSPGLAGIVEITVAGLASCGRDGDGAMHCFGDNYFGQVSGDGVNRDDRLTPTTVPGIAGASDIFTSGGHTCARVSEEPLNLKCWGSGNRGQLGDGGFGGVHERASPAFVTGSPFHDIFGAGRPGSFEVPLP